MKLLMFICTIASLISTTSFANDKKTLIDRIEESDSIPVYVIHGKVSLAQYNPSIQKVPLTLAESQKKYVDGIIPSIIDTNQQYIVDLLNAKFNTTKFYAGVNGSKDSIDNIVAQDQIKFFVYAKFFAEYKYDATPAQRDPQSGKLVAILDLQMSCFLEFNTLKDNPEPIDRLETVISGTIAKVKMDGLITSADEFMKVKSPLSLSSKVMSKLDENLLKFVVKQNAKHEKVVSKRK